MRNAVKISLACAALSISAVASLAQTPESRYGTAKFESYKDIDKIKELKEGFNLTVLMAEQNFKQAVRIADRGYVIVHGKIAFEGRSADELNNNDLVRKLYMGM